jgi:hypothetical protein
LLIALLIQTTLVNVAHLALVKVKFGDGSGERETNLCTVIRELREIYSLQGLNFSVV